MESMKDKCAVVGMGCVKFGENWDKGFDDMIVEAASEAFADAGIDRNDVQAFWFGTQSSAMTGQSLAIPLKVKWKPITRVENACATASDAFRNACYGVASGAYDIVMALGAEKLKDSGIAGLAGMQVREDTNRLQTQTPPGHFALLATRYFARYGLSPEQGRRMIGRVSVKSHYNGSLNPKAHFQSPVTLEQVLNAPIVAWPLGLYDCCGVSDGAAAAIITRADIAKSFKPDPMYVKAVQIVSGDNEGMFMPEYDWTHVEETYRAGLAAYAEAGIENPREQIGMAEVHDCFSITEAVIMEDLQFSPRGGVREDIESGFFDIDGGLSVQPDGGLKCFGHPIGASGIRMLYEMYHQLRGKAGPRQLPNPKWGLTHNLGGYPSGCTISVIIVGAEGEEQPTWPAGSGVKPLA